MGRLNNENNEGRLVFLDGIRGVAIILVILYHYGFLSIGWVGVDLFFVLSGFLISSKLMDFAEKGGDGFFTKFWMKRILRIVPAYFVLLIFCWGCYTYFDRDLIGENHPGWVYPFFMVNLTDVKFGWPAKYTFIHFWSLSCEMQFYLVWPFIIKFILRRKKWLFPVLAAIILLGFLSRYMVDMFSNNVAIARYVLLPCRIDSFTLGALFALMLKYRKFDGISFGKTLSLLSALMLLGVMIFFYKYWHFSDNSINVYILSVNSFFWVAVMAFLYFQRPGFLESKVMTWMGKYSYGLYLFHIPVWLAVNGLGIVKPAPFVGCVATMATLVISWISYNVFEIRFLKLKQIL